jgi:hypothetical protein
LVYHPCMRSARHGGKLCREYKQTYSPHSGGWRGCRQSRYRRLHPCLAVCFAQFPSFSHTQPSGTFGLPSGCEKRAAWWKLCREYEHTYSSHSGGWQGCAVVVPSASPLFGSFSLNSLLFLLLNDLRWLVEPVYSLLHPPAHVHTKRAIERERGEGERNRSAPITLIWGEPVQF